MRKIGIVALALLTTSCATKVAHSGPEGGMIRISHMATNEDEAIQQAEAECAKFGKRMAVRKSSMWTDRLHYDCIE